MLQTLHAMPTTLQLHVTAPALFSAMSVNQPKYRLISEVPHVYYVHQNSETEIQPENW